MHMHMQGLKNPVACSLEDDIHDGHLDFKNIMNILTNLLLYAFCQWEVDEYFYKIQTNLLAELYN